MSYQITVENGSRLSGVYHCRQW